jgi:hypothetical protein
MLHLKRRAASAERPASAPATLNTPPQRGVRTARPTVRSTRRPAFSSVSDVPAIFQRRIQSPTRLRTTVIPRSSSTWAARRNTM